MKNRKFLLYTQDSTVPVLCERDNWKECPEHKHLSDVPPIGKGHDSLGISDHEIVDDPNDDIISTNEYAEGVEAGNGSEPKNEDKVLSLKGTTLGKVLDFVEERVGRARGGFIENIFKKRKNPTSQHYVDGKPVDTPDAIFEDKSKFEHALTGGGYKMYTRLAGGSFDVPDRAYVAKETNYGEETVITFQGSGSAEKAEEFLKLLERTKRRASKKRWGAI